MSVIVTEALSKRYGRAVLALDGVSVAVEPGEIYGFLGPNGAGKSTMIRLLLGFLHPTSGRASVLGLDSERASVEIRGRVGYLPGGVALYDSMTGEALLDYLVLLYGKPAIRRAELLDRLELSETTLRRRVRDYSRGMRQKIGVVQALQHDPELAILDEPTEGLDPLMQRAFYGILDDLKSAGRTIFFSSHVLSEVERVCDRVAIIRRGQIVALEDVESLLARRRRHVELRVSGPTPSLEAIAGVSNVHAQDGLVTFELEGSVAPFVRSLGALDVLDLTIEPAHLEEAFLEFYADDDIAVAPPAGQSVTRDR
jgi:ABC-2 type transport system ATP-binding protein